MEEANGGTLFIDEIGELDLYLQPKLLRALERREVKPLGSNRTTTVDIRVLAATNKDLEQEVSQRNFREDLFYRLAEIRLRLPPLRNRVEDIPILVDQFLREFSDKGGPARASYETMTKLQRHPWPGNVRELRNFVRRALILSESGTLETRFIADGALARPAEAPAAGEDSSLGTIPVSYDLPFKDSKARLIETFEKHYWTRLLNAAAGNISEAARRAGIHRKSLEYLLRKLDIQAR
jgi:DNA-binding NtrC family response regulator